MDKRSLLFIISVTFTLFVVNMYFNFQHEEQLREWKKEYGEKFLEQQEQRAQKSQEATETVASLPSNSLESEPTAFTNQHTSEEFYVLENDYQQFVFSNHGGALVEINLPFHSDSNKESIVKEIGFDRLLAQNSPKNALFPQKPFHANGNLEDLTLPTGGNYYPLLRRHLAGARAVDPKQYALNIVSDYPEVAQTVYAVKSFTKDSITFEAALSHRRITKTFTLPSHSIAAPYCLDVSIDVVKDRNDRRPLRLTTGVPEVEMLSGSPAPTLQYRMTRLKKSEVEAISLPKESMTVTSTSPDWLSNSNGFFGFILDPLTKIDSGYRVDKVDGTLLPSRLVALDNENSQFKAADLPGYNLSLPLRQEGGQMKFRFYAGPFAESTLNVVDATFADSATGYFPDYISCKAYHGWFSFIATPFSKFLFMLMNFFYSITTSWAFSIILLTVALRLMLYPLNAWSMKSMRRMQQVGPMVQAIQEKYKKDPKRAQLEVINIYREQKVNPMMGCFPMLLQMPFLFGMFDLLKSTFELRGASFIPGWIDNLTAPDVVFDWGYHVPFFGSEFHLLPLLLAGVMYFQQKMTTVMPKDPSQMTEQQQQQKLMGNMMVIVMSTVFYHFPSGLNIYWLSSMSLGIAQQWITNKQLNKA